MAKKPATEKLDYATLQRFLPPGWALTESGELLFVGEEIEARITDLTPEDIERFLQSRR